MDKPVLNLPVTEPNAARRIFRVLLIGCVVAGATGVAIVVTCLILLTYL